MEQKNHELQGQHLLSSPQQPSIQPLLHHHISQQSNFDPRPNANLHNQLASLPNCRQEQPLSERLSHIMQTQVNHDPRLQNNQFRNQNPDSIDINRFHQSVMPNTQEPPPIPAPAAFKSDVPSFKQDLPGFNHVNSNFQERQSDVNIPPPAGPSSQLPFNQPPPGFPQPPLSFPPRAYYFRTS